MIDNTLNISLDTFIDITELSPRKDIKEHYDSINYANERSSNTLLREIDKLEQIITDVNNYKEGVYFNQFLIGINNFSTVISEFFDGSPTYNGILD